MRRLLYNLVTLLITVSASAQMAYQTSNGDVSLRVNANGILAVDIEDLSPKSSFEDGANHFLRQAGIWISARDANDDLFVASQMYLANDEFDLWPGPLDTFTASQANGDWNKVWKVSTVAIQAHKENYNSDGYQVASEIANWPAYSGEDLIQHLAPFADVNANAIYEPEEGDYPVIKGDEAIYAIFNDNRSEHKVSNAMPLEIEIHLLLYSFNNDPNRIFLEYTVINRSDRDYQDVNLGFFLWAENGYRYDNYMLSYRDENALAFYNGDKQDEGHFEFDIPYVYAKFMDRPMTYSMRIWNDNNSIQGMPSEDIHFDNYLNAKWLNGEVLNDGPNGLLGSSRRTLIYTAENAWNEEMAGNVPGERLGLITTTYPALTSKGFVSLTVGLEFGHMDTTDNPHLFLKKQLNEMRTYTSISSQLARNEGVDVYPNPSSGRINVEIEQDGNYSIRLIDLFGRTVYSEELQINDTVQVNLELTPGVYVLELADDEKVRTKRIVIEP